MEEDSLASKLKSVIEWRISGTWMALDKACLERGKVVNVFKDLGSRNRIKVFQRDGNISSSYNFD